MTPRKPSLFSRLGPFAYLLLFCGSIFVILSLFRLGYTSYNWARVAEVDQYWKLFFYGLRMDAIVACGLASIPALLLLLIPGEKFRPLSLFLRIYYVVCILVVTAMEAITFSYLQEYDARPNRLFIENLVPTREIVQTLFEAYKVELALAAALLVFTVWKAWGLAGQVLRGMQTWRWHFRLPFLIPVFAVLTLGARGYDHRPVNSSSACFSSDRLVNQLALNSLYSAVDAANRMRHENSPFKLYGSMPVEEILQRVKANLWQDEDSFVSGGAPFERRQIAKSPQQRPYNFVIVLEESLGAEYIGALGGADISPEFDALAKEGLLFTNLYSTGTRTVRGLEAVLSSFLPTPGRSVVKLDKSQQDFFTIAGLLKAHGYATEFVYGGEGHFDNMRSFMFGNGFDRVLDQHDFEDPAFRGTWGVSDEDLMRKANETFVAHGDEPFFALILSTSNHSPFEFPDGRIELYEEPKQTRFNTSKYADFAVGELFRAAKQEDYFENTIWLVVADHSTRVFGEDLIPVRKFHIPGLIIGPGVEPGTYDKLASQIDLTPTVLSMLGIDTTHAMLGRDVLALPARAPGRAILQQFDTHAYMLEDQVWIHQPNQPVRQFTYTEQHLVPATLDPDKGRDALAHALVPWILYDEQTYRLPSQD